MEIVRADYKKGNVELRVNDQEDLWYLSHIIDPGDLVRGKTTRKVKIGDGENAKVTKRTLTLTVEAETIEFGSSGTELRVNGKIKEGPEDIPKDSFHAISIELGTEFTLSKSSWQEYQKNKLKEAAEKKYSYLICLFDREEVLFAITKKFGYDVLVKIKGDVPKKNQDEGAKKDFYTEIIKMLTEYNQRYTPEAVIIASPAFYKEDLLKKITDPQLKPKIILAVCSDVEETSLDEVIKRPELAQLLKSSRIREEKIVVEELLNAISKEGAVAYGIGSVEKASQAGAIVKLLLTDEFVQQQRQKGRYVQLDQLMKSVDQAKGEVHIVSAQQESGKKINGLGGIAAILRYKLWQE